MLKLFVNTLAKVWLELRTTLLGLMLWHFTQLRMALKQTGQLYINLINDVPLTLHYLFTHKYFINLQGSFVLLRKLLEILHSPSDWCLCCASKSELLFCLQVCHLHVWIYAGRCASLFAMYARVSQGLHWWLADAFLHMPFVHGASRCCTVNDIWDKLMNIVAVDKHQLMKPWNELLGTSARGILLHIHFLSFHPNFHLWMGVEYAQGSQSFSIAVVRSWPIS